MIVNMHLLHVLICLERAKKLNKAEDAEQLLELCIAEIEDAIEVLERKPAPSSDDLNPGARDDLEEALDLIAEAAAENNRKNRNSLSDEAIAALEAARLEGEREDWPGKDSEFYLIDARMKSVGLGRRADELVSRWLIRLSQAGLEAPAIEALRSIVLLHHRYRFDPNALTVIERGTLREEVDRWLSNYAPGATAAG